jgi:hypothetical protein
MTDTDRLDWIAKNGALIRCGGELSPDPYFFIVYKNGETSDSRPTYRGAIDAAMLDNENV